MDTQTLVRFSVAWTLGLLLLIVGSAYLMPYTIFLNTVSGGTRDGAKEALSLLKDSTVWMAGLQTATIAALGLMAKEGVSSLKLNALQVKLAVLVVLFNSLALFFSAWLLTSLPSLMLRMYKEGLADYDVFNLTLYSYMSSSPAHSVFTVHYFAFWNHWLWGCGIVLFGALAISLVIRRE